MTIDQQQRTAREVFGDHLRLRKEGGTETDIAVNYANDVVVLSGTGIHRGRDGVRETARILGELLPNSTFEYRHTLVEREYALLEWTAVTEDGREVCDGADSFVIRDGRIVMQKIHYSIHERGS